VYMMPPIGGLTALWIFGRQIELTWRDLRRRFRPGREALPRTRVLSTGQGTSPRGPFAPLSPASHVLLSPSRPSHRRRRLPIPSPPPPPQSPAAPPPPILPLILPQSSSNGSRPPAQEAPPLGQGRRAPLGRAATACRRTAEMAGVGGRAPAADWDRARPGESEEGGEEREAGLREKGIGAREQALLLATPWRTAAGCAGQKGRGGAGWRREAGARGRGGGAGARRRRAGRASHDPWIKNGFREGLVLDYSTVKKWTDEIHHQKRSNGYEAQIAVKPASYTTLDASTLGFSNHISAMFLT
jgi:hypothetical protein